jgi:hypothetical protein
MGMTNHDTHDVSGDLTHALLMTLTTQLMPALDVCPVSAFTAALLLVGSALSNGTIDRVGGTNALVRHYVETMQSAQCVVAEPEAAADAPRHRPRAVEGEDAAVARATSAAWPPSRRASGTGLLINAGEGTTGTRFLDCVLRALGARTAHNDERLLTCGSRGGSGGGAGADEPSCTRCVDEARRRRQLRCRAVSRGPAAARRHASDGLEGGCLDCSSGRGGGKRTDAGR